MGFLMSSKIKSFFINLITPRAFPLLFSFTTMALLLIYFNNHLQDFPILYAQDDYGYVADVVQHHYIANKKAILFLGGSTAKEAIIDRKIIENALSTTQYKDYQFWSLTSNSQSFSQSLSILNTINPLAGSLVILGITPHGFTENSQMILRGYKQPLIPFLNDAQILSQLNKDVKNHYWIPQLIHNASWIKRRIDTLFNPRISNCFSNFIDNRRGCLRLFVTEKWWIAETPYPTDRHFYGKNPLSKLEKEKFTEWYINEIFSSVFNNSRESFKYLQALVNFTTSHHVKLILMILPRSPMSQTVDKTIWPTIIPYLTRLASDSVTFKNFEKYPGFVEDDFFDLYHFEPSGRNKFTPIFMNLLLGSATG